jgi:hypothetical protein
MTGNFGLRGMGLEQPTYAITVRLPSWTEYWQAASLPSAGGTISHCGRAYVVVSCEHLNGSAYVLQLAERDPISEVDALPAAAPA